MSDLFTKTRREAPSDEISKNAQLLVQAGYVDKQMAGVYNYLPLGLMVVENIKQIIREEMNAVGGQELHLSTLQTKDVWEPSDRWNEDVWFKTKLANGGDVGLAFTHEEPITKIAKQHITSYKDLPRSAYQFQTKFRNEERAKSGIMRGREFLMKDLYYFAKNSNETDSYYEKVKDAYVRIFEKLGIGSKTYITISSGGSFSKYSYEFQTISDAGEDIICVPEDEHIAINKDDFTEEVLNDFAIEDQKFTEHKSIEVGDIYKLGTRFSRALGLVYADEDGTQKPVDMSSYGIGVSRLVGALVEVLSDEKGIVWPETVAPYKYHVVVIDGEGVQAMVQRFEEKHDAMIDDRNVSVGQKMNDADLLGMPYRVVISPKTVEKNSVEIKARTEDDARLVMLDELE